ncbi:MAG TPA: hypothetical protein VGL63_17750 [Streptosporangiaceae bacterium]|jgi:hypothetical protein
MSGEELARRLLRRFVGRARPPIDPHQPGEPVPGQPVDPHQPGEPAPGQPIDPHQPGEP